VRDWSHWQFHVLPVLRRSADRSSANFNGMLSDQAVSDRRSKLDSTQKAMKPVAWAAGHLGSYTARGLHGSPGPRLRQFRRRDRGAQENFPNFTICGESARTATAVGSWAAVSFGLARPTGVDRPRRHDLGLQCARCRLRGGCWPAEAWGAHSDRQARALAGHRFV
jgi:hypothetical protein